MPQTEVTKRANPASPTVAVERPADTLAWIEARVGHAAALRGAASGELLQKLHIDDDCVVAAQLTVLPADAETEACIAWRLCKG